MLFNSYVFIFAFLPVTLVVFYMVARRSRRFALAWLVVASLAFYGWWDPRYVPLLLFSICANYTFGTLLTRYSKKSRPHHKVDTTLLIAGIFFNLGLLGYFKYTNFFVDTSAAVFGTSWSIAHVVLPLGISFFTFTQLAYLVDAYRGEAKKYNFIDYCLFVTVFPHLIAGPILHHREMMPQFANSPFHPRPENFAVGSTIFIAGLFKKVILADWLAIHASSVFDAAASGAALTFFEAWGGTIAYTLQIYFDFSGYSDMAIGLGRMLALKLPLNFNSPYQAVSITDFWARWHMSLTRFLREYLYFPLGGSRKGEIRRYANILITMLLSGLWHGAGWTFVLWGGLHGVFLVVHHLWQKLAKSMGIVFSSNVGLTHWFSRGLTFLAVAVAWVLFRAGNLSVVSAMLQGMTGKNGFSLPKYLQGTLPGGDWLSTHLGISFGGLGSFGSDLTVIGVLVLLLVVWFAPNTIQVMARFDPSSDKIQRPSRLQWRMTLQWAVVFGVMAGVSLLALSHVSAFLYYQF